MDLPFGGRGSGPVFRTLIFSRSGLNTTGQLVWDKLAAFRLPF